MKITYTGRQVELRSSAVEEARGPVCQDRQTAGWQGEREAHVVLSLERQLHKAEATINYYDHQLVGVGSAARSVHCHSRRRGEAGKAGVKARTKWRDAKRTPRKSAPEAETEKTQPSSRRPSGASAGATRQAASEAQAHDAGGSHARNGHTHDYLVYRDAETDRVSVLVRRRDGHFDLVEG